MTVKEQNIALEEMVTEYANDLFAWAKFKTGSKEVAEDLVQETFLSAAKSFKKFSGKSTSKTWLFSILKNKIADYFKQRFLQQEYSFEDQRNYFGDNGKWLEKEKPIVWEDEEHLLDNPEFNEILISCLKKLPETWEIAIKYKYLTSKKAEEICQDLEITKSNYWQLIHRAKLQLRACLDLNWFKTV